MRYLQSAFSCLAGKAAAGQGAIALLTWAAEAARLPVRLSGLVVVLCVRLLVMCMSGRGPLRREGWEVGGGESVSKIMGGEVMHQY